MRSDEISVQLDKILTEFVGDERDKLAENISKAAKQAKRDIVQASPNGPKNYRKGWTVRTVRRGGSVSAVVHNKTYPGLTHLLEKSHVIKNANGTYGRTSPGHGQVEHIGPAAEDAERYLLELIGQM